MRIELLHTGARNACIRFADGGLYHTREVYELRVNGNSAGQMNTVVHSLFGLKPNGEYKLELFKNGKIAAAVSFWTKQEYVTLDPRDFGAKGDGVKDDTAAVQAAILSCPAESRVLLSKGRYLVSGIFLKSHIRLEIAKGAALLLTTDRKAIPILPGMTESWDEESYYNLGTWEGNPLSMHAALLTGIDVEDVEIYGEGLLDGQAQLGDWWQEPKRKQDAWRGRMLFLNRCRGIKVQGLSFQNSPSWNLHPYFSEDLGFYNLNIEAPANSPNTDGFNPESCRHTVMAGTLFSLGDDCVAIKSGKLYMGHTYRTPCEDIRIMNCLMENGHGGLTIGSEMAGGVRDVLLQDCLMRNTDRGLRVKTRRGRGRQGKIDNIRFERVRMENVKCPIVINCHYSCDPDGHSSYVQSREALPVDERTPFVGRLSFEDIQAEGCHWAAAYIEGLEEQKIAHVDISNTRFSYADDAEAAVPAMADHVEAYKKGGIIAHNIDTLFLDRIQIEGCGGEKLALRNVSQVIGEIKL